MILILGIWCFHWKCFHILHTNNQTNLLKSPINPLEPMGRYLLKLNNEDSRTTSISLCNLKWFSLYMKYLHTENLRHQLIPPRNIVDQRILLSDWTRDTLQHTQPEVKVSGPIFHSWLSPAQKPTKNSLQNI